MKKKDPGMQKCTRCRKTEPYNGDWFDGMCPSCADATEPPAPETTVTDLLFALARLCDRKAIDPNETYLMLADMADIQTITHTRGRGFDTMIFTDASHTDKSEDTYIDPKKVKNGVLNDKTLTDEEQMEEMPRIVSCLGGLLRKVVGADWVDDLCSAIKGEPIK